MSRRRYKLTSEQLKQDNDSLEDARHNLEKSAKELVQLNSDILERPIPIILPTEQQLHKELIKREPLMRKNMENIASIHKSIFKEYYILGVHKIFYSDPEHHYTDDENPASKGVFQNPKTCFGKIENLQGMASR